MRISTTNIEAYRRLIEYEYVKEEELIRQIRGEPVEMPWYVHAGSAWDRLLSTSRGTVQEDGLRVKVGDYIFAIADHDAAERFIGPGVWQAKQTAVFQTDYGPATVVAQADHLRGLLVTDVKYKHSTPDARDYESGLQWRFYLLVHEAAAFRYCLFDFADQKDGYCALKGMSSFKFWPYAAMQAECESWLNRFLGWADSRSLLSFLDRPSSSRSIAA